MLVAPHASAVLPGLALVALIAVYDRYHKASPLTVLAMAGCRVGVFVELLPVRSARGRRLG
jgi:hypothetical protein